MFIRKSLVNKLLADDRIQREMIQDLQDRVNSLEYETKMNPDELDVDEATARKLALLKPQSASIKNLLFAVIDYVGLMPVYDQGRKPGFQLAQKPMPKNDSPVKEESRDE